MKKICSSLLIIGLAIGFTGCGSSIQHVLKPDIKEPLNNTESIIQLKRADHFAASARKPNVLGNDKLIGEIANGDELVWKTKADSLECITVDWFTSTAHEFYAGLTLDDTPFAYKCFTTKPKEILSLNYDLLYPKMRIAQPIAFTPIYKDIDKSKVTPISINSISNSLKTESSNDLTLLLRDAIKKQFKNNLISSSNKTIDIEILDYKTGNAALRWLAASNQASTHAKVKVTIKEKNITTDTFITRPVISHGGLYTIGGDTLIFDEIAEDIYLSLFPL